MKSLKTSLLAFALMAGVIGAFATTAPKSHHAKKDTHNWQTTNANGTVKSTLSGGTYVPDLADREAAVEAFSCDQGSDYCAIEVDSENGTPIDNAEFLQKN